MTASGMMRVVLLGGLLAGGSADASDLLLVVPGREGPVKIGQDMTHMRPDAVELVAYRRSGQTGKMLFHAWDGSSGGWLAVANDEFAKGAFLRTPVRRVLVLGTPFDGISEVAGAIDWTDDVIRQTSLAVADIMPLLDRELSFTAPEWAWLAQRYGIELRDRNEQRRRYGRYGEPGQRRMTPPAPPQAWQPAPAAEPTRPAAAARRMVRPAADETATEVSPALPPADDATPAPASQPAAVPDDVSLMAPALTEAPGTGMAPAAAK